MAEKARTSDEILDSVPGLRQAINEAVEKGIKDAQTIPKAVHKMDNEPGIKPQYYHPGAFNHSKLTDSLEEVYCEECGSFERRPIPVVEKTEYKDKIPDDYMPKPKTTGDLLKLIDAGHADGTPWDKCPNCTAAVTDWVHNNTDKLKGINLQVTDIPQKKK